MPFRTQTVQSEESPYLSPFPVNKPQIKFSRNPENALERVLAELPDTLSTVSSLLKEMETDSKTKLNSKKYSYHEEEQ